MQRRSRGFTLIEVLAALVIVSIGMLAVIQAVNQTVGNGTYLRDKTIAHWIAMNQLTTMRLAPAPPAVGESNGEAQMANQRWRWSAKVTQTAVASMKRIDIAVRSSEGDDDSQLAVVTGFYGERIAKPGTVIATFTPTAAPPPNPNPNPNPNSNPDPAQNPNPPQRREGGQ